MLLSLENVKKIYVQNRSVSTNALNGIHLNVKKGDFLAIMGPSGCGKSTLLNLMGLLDVPSTGELLFLDQNVNNLKEKQRTTLRKENIGFVFQSFNLIDELTAFENIELPLTYLGFSSAERRKKVEETLVKLHLSHRADFFPQQLSGGQQQRIAIARAIITNPKLLLADEPTGNLDSKNGEEIMKILFELNQQGTTIVMVTHSSYDADYAHRKIQLFDGIVVSEQWKKDV